MIFKLNESSKPRSLKRIIALPNPIMTQPVTTTVVSNACMTVPITTADNPDTFEDSR